MSRTVNFDNADHALDLISRLYEMRMDERHCDFVIKVGSERIPAHRNVLAAMSDYFDRMLFHDTIENSSGMVDMKNVDPDCVRICVDFIYGREVEVSDEKYEDLMHVANLMQLNKLVKIVENIISQNLNAKSFVAAKKIADMYACETLQSECKDFADGNFLSISLEDEFGDLDKSYVTETIKSRSVKMTENEKFDAVLRWVKHDVEARSEDLAHILECIDLRFVPIEKRQQLVHDDFFKVNVSSVRILCSSIIQSLKCEIDRGKEKAIVIFDYESGHLHQFKPRSNSWRLMHRMSKDMRQILFSAIVNGDHIYVFMWNKEVFRLKYTDEASTWEQMAEMIEDHGRCPLVVVVGRLFYAIGGHAYCLTKCVERFDPETNNWTKLQDKPQATSNSTLLVMRGCVYSFGGLQKDVQWINNVQRFDLITSEWKEMKPMREAKGGMAALELNRKAYVMGGIDGGYFTSVDCYDVEMDQWTSLAPMKNLRYWFRAFAIGGSIYAVGGNSSDSIENYDVEKNKWTIVPMPSGIKYHFRESVEIKLD